jgi:transcriptional regulator with PAS, ATPase and Fis domain
VIENVFSAHRAPRLVSQDTHLGIPASAARAASAHCALLITGETGTGKGHLARWIHEHSQRRSGPFVPVNCGAIPDSLIDSHLFGHAKGAFSGATADHLGLVRAAQGGTLLLDEITDLPASAQLRLLRLLEEREVQPVGYSRPVKVDVRIIAATNSDLQAAVRSGRFRQDLYFRLDVVGVRLPPLRERTDEIPQFLNQFNSEFAGIYAQPPLTINRHAWAMLERYAWPGNVREVRTVMERLHVLCGGDFGVIGVQELETFGQLRLRSITVPDVATDRLSTLKVRAVEETLACCRGNMSRAASELGVHRSTLYRWLADRKLSA